MIDFYGVTISYHEIGYLAGIMDGEGTIHIRPNIRHPNLNQKSDHPTNQ